MNFLSSLIKRLEIIAFIFGFTAGIYMLVFAPARYFIIWHALPAPPESIEKIISANHMGDLIVKTISNKKFACNLYNEKECWTELDANSRPFDTNDLCFKEDCPNKHTLQMIKASAALHGFGKPSTIYSLNDDGIVYVKHTGVVYWPGYVVGTIIGGFCAFAAFVGKNLLIGIISLFQKDKVK